MPSQVFDVFIENQHVADAAEGFGLVDILFRLLSQSLTSQAEPSYIHDEPFQTSNCAPESARFFLKRLRLLSPQVEQYLKAGATTGNRT